MRGLNMSWKLESIFLNLDEYKKEAASIFETANNLESESSISEKTFHRFTEISILAERVQAYVELKLSLDRTDIFFLDEEQRLSILDAKIKNIEKKFVHNPQYLSILKGNPQYGFYYKGLIKKHKHVATEDVESLITDCERFSSSNWISLKKAVLQSALSSAGSSLSVANSKQLNASSEIRAEGFKEEKEICVQIQDIACRALNAIKSENYSVAKARGHQSILDMQLFSEGNNQQLLDAALDTIELSRESISAGAILKQRKMGEESFKWYNLSYIQSNASLPFLPYERAISIIKDALLKFDSSAISLTDSIIQDGIIDHEIRPLKRAGASCRNLFWNQHTYILLSYVGSLKNFTSLAHEIGHAYHYYLMNKEGFLSSDAPISIKESAGDLFEIMACNELCSQMPEFNQQVDELQITGVSSTLLEVNARYLFEKRIAEQCNAHYFTVNELNEIMVKAQETAFGNLGKGVLHPLNWVSKPHFYYANRPFYNYPYILGRLLSFHLYRIIRSEPSSTSTIVNMFQNSGKLPMSESLKRIGITGSVDAWRHAIDEITTLFNHYLEMQND